MSNYNDFMRNLLANISKIYEKGNRFIINELKTNGADGLVPSHGDILLCLYKFGKISMKEISEKIHRTKPTVTILVNKLEKLGYLKREMSENDGRYTYITLSKKGEDFRPIFEKISKKLNDYMCKNLSKKEADKLEELLKKVI